ncbi:MAG: type I methionyl aminopeptidase [Coriobacteriaceae bacterium]|nr:type I methionyl aminopeptidase [Coriobacteriaceae bacterium]
MIYLKTPEQIEAMKEAGRISAKVLRLVGAAVEPGISTKELDAMAERLFKAEGAKPGFKGYGGFPGSICASVNNQIVHGIPSKKTILHEGDIISIDTGALLDGWYGDNAWTYPVGEVTPEVQRLLEVTEQSMWNGLEAAKAGNHLGDIGTAVEHLAHKNHLGVVRELVGHGIGRDMHEEPNVPNYGLKHFGRKLVAGMCLAIEPMFTLGSRKIAYHDDGWLITTIDGSWSAHFEKSVAITDEGTIVLTTEPGYERPVG